MFFLFLVSDEGVFDTLSVQLRLIDIEATARLDLDNYQGPWLDMVMLRVHEVNILYRAGLVLSVATS